MNTTGKLPTTYKREEEIGCWNCALEGIRTGKPVCPDCGTEIAHNCKKYSHQKVVYAEKSEIKKEG